MVYASVKEWADAFSTLMNTGLIKNNYFYIDLWSVAHIVAGIILMYVIVKYKILNGNKTKQIILVGVIAILWELYEWVFYSRGIFFAVDTKANIFWDVGFDMLGAWFYTRAELWINKEAKDLAIVKKSKNS